MKREDVYRTRALAARVRRYHTWPVLYTQTVGEHCARVAQIYCEFFGVPLAEVLYYILHHDSGELLSGDIPFPSKSLSPSLRRGANDVEDMGLQKLEIVLPELSPEERRKIKIADLLEMHEFGSIETAMGNSLAEPIVNDTWAAAIEMMTVSEREFAVRWTNGGHRD